MARKRYKVVLLIGSGGGGHYATARALKDACASAKLNFDFEVLDVAVILGISVTVGDGIYNWLMSSGRARWISAWHNLGKMLSTINERSITEMFRSYLSQYEFDMLVTCIPFVNKYVAEALSTFKPVPPMVTLLSDFENSTDHQWMQDHRQHLICGTIEAVKQAEALGHPIDRVYGTSGMIVHPSFYEPLKGDRREERIKLGLHPDFRTVCILFGGFAPVFLPQVVQILKSVEEPLNLILMCGKNKDALLDTLKPLLSTPYTLPDNLTTSTDNDQPESKPHHRAVEIVTETKDTHTFIHLVGFTDQVAYFMRLSDFLVGKPGPGVISEALVIGLPVIVELNEEHTPPQEKAVARWINDHGVGVVIESFEDLPYAITLERLKVCKENVDKIKNNAVFEVPHILSGILKNTERRHRRILSATNPKDMSINIQSSTVNTSSVPSSPALPSKPRTTSVSSILNLESGVEGLKLGEGLKLADGNANGSISGQSNEQTLPEESSLGGGSNSGIVAVEPQQSVVIFERIDSLSVNHSSYSDAIHDFQEPLRLDEELMTPFRMLINASGRWGHDVIKFDVRTVTDSDTFEITLSTGYYVTWMKELVVLSGNDVKARLGTKNDDHGPKTISFRREDFPSGAIKLEFHKAGFLGVKTLGYVRYLDALWCCGKQIHFLWQRERFSIHQPNG